MDVFQTNWVLVYSVGAAIAQPFPTLGPAAAHFLSQQLEFVAKGTWARLACEMSRDEERFDFFCANLVHLRAQSTLQLQQRQKQHCPQQ